MRSPIDSSPITEVVSVVERTSWLLIPRQGQARRGKAQSKLPAAASTASTLIIPAYKRPGSKCRPFHPSLAVPHIFNTLFRHLFHYDAPKPQAYPASSPHPPRHSAVHCRNSSRPCRSDVRQGYLQRLVHFNLLLLPSRYLQQP